MRDKINICVLTYPFVDPVGATILSNFIDILEPTSTNLFVITGKYLKSQNKRVRIINVKSDAKRESIGIRGMKFLIQQLIITFNIIKISMHVNIVIFFLGTRLHLLPMLSAKLLGKKTVLTVTSPITKAAKIPYSDKSFGVRFIIQLTFKIIEKLNLFLADQIAIETENVIQFAGLNKYRKKISINGAMYIDTDSFRIKKELKNRRNLVGYIGRLSPEKCVINFAKAIPLILKEDDDLEFLIGGNGPLFDEIKNELKNNGSYNKVELTGWIPHDKLPYYLNELKLIILPSYSEGLPGIVQEGMACGALVLATSVGGIPDLIKDGATGFIMEDNSPECIAKDVIRALERPNLDESVKNARKLIEDKYSYEVMVRKCKIALDELMERK